MDLFFANVDFLENIVSSFPLKDGKKARIGSGRLSNNRQKTTL